MLVANGERTRVTAVSLPPTWLRGLRALALLGSAVLAASCAEPTAPRDAVRPARLAVAPRFQVLPADAPVITLTHIRGVLISPSGDSVVVDAPFVNGQAVLAFDVKVSPAGGAFTLDLVAFDQMNTPVFHSRGVVPVQPGENPSVTPPELVYSAPDADVKSIKISPAAPSLNAGAQLSLGASGTRANGEVVNEVRVGWVSRDTRIATVSDQGVLRAGQLEGATWIVATTVNGVKDSTRVSVRAPVASVNLSAARTSLLRGETLQLSAQAVDLGNTVLAGRGITFTSGTPEVATVSSTGLVTAIAVGTTTVTAESEGKTSTVTLTVGSPVASIRTNGPLSFASLGTTQRITPQLVARTGASVTGSVVRYASRDPRVATVDASGVVTAVGNGATDVDVTVDNVTAAVRVQVQQVATRLTLSPATATIATAGGTQAFAPTATDANGQRVTTGFTWTSSDPTVATVDNAGTATARATGQTTITAARDGLSATATLAVALPIGSLTITPSSIELARGTSRTLTLEVRDVSGRILSGLTPVWSTSDVVIATVDQSGTVRANHVGTGTVMAQVGALTAVASLNVVSPVTFINVNPSQLTFTALGQTQHLEASPVAYPGASLAGVSVGFRSLNNTIVTVNSQGDVTAVANGRATIQAFFENVSVNIPVTVQQQAVRIVVTPPSASATVAGQQQQFQATAYDVTDRVVGAPATWATSDPNVATVNGVGLVTAVGSGRATITASVGSVTGSATYEVRTAVSTVTITPASPEIVRGTALQVAVKVADAGGRPITGRPSTFASSNPLVATVGADGTVTGVAVGKATISATVEGVSGSTDVTVVSPVASITASPSSIDFTAIGQTQPLNVTLNPRGSASTAGLTPTFSTDNPSVATVTTGGAVTSRGPGRATITIAVEGVTSTVAVTVKQATAGVLVSPKTTTLPGVGVTTKFTATVVDPLGAPILAAPVVWTSTNNAVVTVDALGLAKSMAVGSAQIIASSGGRADTAAVTVQQVPVGLAVRLSMDSALVGQMVQATATLVDAAGSPLPTSGVSFTSSDPGVATVTSTGFVTAVSPGTVEIRASASGFNGLAILRVVVPAGSGPGSLRSAPGTVLVFDGSYGAGYSVAAEAQAAGWTVTRWSNAQWQAATAADFARFDVVAIPYLGSDQDAAVLAAGRSSTWGAAVTGNAVLAGLHVEHQQTGSYHFVRNALLYAGGGTKTGFVAFIDCTSPANSSKAYSGWLPQRAPFAGVSGYGCVGLDDVKFTDVTHPLLAGNSSVPALTEAELSHWSNSVHSYFVTTGGFTVVGNILDYGRLTHPLILTARGQ